MQAKLKHAALPAPERQSAQALYALQKARLSQAKVYFNSLATALLLFEIVAFSFPAALPRLGVFWAAKIDNLCGLVYSLVAGVLMPVVLQTQDAKFDVWYEQ